MPLPRSTREAIPVGQSVAHFRVTGTLGEGGMGIVYVAEDEKLHRKVALKILHPDVAGNSQRRRRFLREARVAGSVTHPSIATVYEVGEHEGRIYIAMELVEGTSLKKKLESGAIPFAESMRIARLVARGLVKAHEAGIIHRDLKPDNIMIGEDEIVKILDFGLAKPREKEQARPELWSGQGIESSDDPSTEIETARWALVGTPSYMSPEQAKGREVDERSDLFSLGVILYEMLTSKRPFKGETWQEVIISINRDNPLPPSVVNPDVSKVVDPLLTKCMEKEPSRRYANCRELVAAIDEALGRDSLFDSGMRPVPAGAPQALGLASPAPSPSNPENAPAAPDVPAPPPPPELSPASATPSSSSRAGIVGGLVAGLVVGSAVLLFAKQKMHNADAAPTSSALTSASVVVAPPPPPKGAVTDQPLPKTGNADARAAYSKGLQALRDGAISMAGQELRHSVELDPGLAAGALRNILYDSLGGARDERRRYFQIANQLRASLTERDQGLLQAVEPKVLRDVPDRKEALKRTSELAQKYPGDAEIQLVLAQAELDVDHQSQAEKAADRALAIDPKYAMASWFKAVIAQSEGDAQGVQSAVTQCLAITPSASSCLQMKAMVEVLNGDCPAFEADARQMVAVEPTGQVAHLWLARALASKGEAQEAVWIVLQNQSKSVSPTQQPEVEHKNRAAVAALYGDFVTAEKELLDLGESLASNQTQSGHASMAQLVSLYRETGELLKAGKVAKEYLDKKAAWVADDASVEGLMIAAAAHVELLPRADVIARREKTIAELRAELPGAQANAAWLYGYAWPAESAEEAREALQVMKDYTPIPSPLALEGLPIAEGLIGKVYALAGKPDDAIPLLKRSTSACLALSFPFEKSWLDYQLGQVLETKGDTTGACASYKSIVDRWGQAKPRSTTADKARARIAGLVCNR